MEQTRLKTIWRPIAAGSQKLASVHTYHSCLYARRSVSTHLSLRYEHQTMQARQPSNPHHRCFLLRYLLQLKTDGRSEKLSASQKIRESLWRASGRWAPSLPGCRDASHDGRVGRQHASSSLCQIGAGRMSMQECWRQSRRRDCANCLVFTEQAYSRFDPMEDRIV